MPSYMRVIPRDLFNEASLLKCIGHLYIAIDGLEGVALVHDGGEVFFDVRQNPSDGSIFVSNIQLVVRGHIYRLSRPLNSRQPWPLYVDVADETLEVFDVVGHLSEDMDDFLKGEARWQ